MFDVMSAAVEALLPPGMAEYHAACERKHFSSDAVGSVFDRPRSLRGLLELTFFQRGGLDGDDRAAFLALGAQPAALLDDVRYLLVRCRGRVGVVPRQSLDGGERVRVVQAKPGSAPSVVLIDARPRLRCSFGCVVIGAGRDGGDVCFTAHPGLPIVPVEHGLAPGVQLTVAQLPPVVEWLQIAAVS